MKLYETWDLLHGFFKKKQVVKQYKLYASLERDIAMEVDMDTDVDLRGEQQTLTQR